MVSRKLIVPIVLLSVLALATYIYSLYQPPDYKQRLMFKDPAKSVQDSMRVLRQLCESVNSQRFMNCIVSSYDSTMVFNGKSLGKFKSVAATNEGFSRLAKKDAERLLSIMKFLQRNLISGVVHDTSIGFWLYSYGENPDYNNIKFIRSIYIWDEPKDTLNPAFRYYFTNKDRKENMVLVGYNNIQGPFSR